MRPPNDHQLAAIRAELHDLADTIIDALNHANHIRHEYARGYPTSSGGGTGGAGGWSDPTFAAALPGIEDDPKDKIRTPDPAAVAERLQRQIDGWIKHGRQIHGLAAKLAADTRPVGTDERKKLAARRNLTDTPIETCAMCGLPNPKMHRVDGQPYCASSCYYRAWRQRTAG